MDGFIIINKQEGITSFDVIRRLRKILKIRKIGHAGTLDPMATGVLIVGVGKATRLLSQIEALTKTYEAEMLLGISTDTYDITGTKVCVMGVENFSQNKIEETLEYFKGESMQLPPMYSAIKINGKKLYELARKNIEVERKLRKINIFEIKFLNFVNNKISFITEVSKGTYIRSLIYDIGKKLENVATMSKLKRTKIGNFDIENSYTLDEIEDKVISNSFDFMLSVENIFKEKQNIMLKEIRELNLYKNGNTLVINKKDGLYKIYFEDQFIGLGNIINNRMKGYKYF